VLNSINLSIPAGKKVALVGESGCGKSTVIQLIERFYDPVAGTVMIDGLDVRDMSLDYLRHNVGYVG
jgi:ABC-type multidrug transport system fused ATPase/permease subunit